MSTFKDNKGNIWGVDLTVGKAMKIKSETGLDFVEALSNIGVAYKVIGKMEQDLFTFCKVFYVLVNANEQGYSIEQFADCMGGEVIANAFDAMDTALTNFYPLEKREKIARMKEKFQGALSEGQDTIIDELEARIPEMKAMINKGIQEHLNESITGT